jgi:hypothetical protein
VLQLLVLLLFVLAWELEVEVLVCGVEVESATCVVVATVCVEVACAVFGDDDVVGVFPLFDPQAESRTVKQRQLPSRKRIFFISFPFFI